MSYHKSIPYRRNDNEDMHAELNYTELNQVDLDKLLLGAGVTQEAFVETMSLVAKSGLWKSRYGDTVDGKKVVVAEVSGQRGWTTNKKKNIKVADSLGGVRLVGIQEERPGLPFLIRWTGCFASFFFLLPLFFTVSRREKRQRMEETETQLAAHDVVGRLNCCIGSFALYPRFHLHNLPHHAHPKGCTHRHHDEHSTNHDHSHDPHEHAHEHQFCAHIHAHPPMQEVKLSKEEEERIEEFVQSFVKFALALPNESSLALLAGKAAPVEVSGLVDSFFNQMTTGNFSEVVIHKILGDHRVEELLSSLWMRLAIYEGGVELYHARELLAVHDGSSLSLDDVLGFKYGGDYQSLLDTELQELFHRCPWLPADRSTIHFVFVGAGMWYLKKKKNKWKETDGFLLRMLFLILMKRSYAYERLVVA